MRGWIDREPGEAEGAAGHAARRLVERAMGQHERIGADAPILADRHRDFVVALLQIGGMVAFTPSPTTANVALLSLRAAIFSLIVSPLA